MMISRGRALPALAAIAAALSACGDLGGGDAAVASVTAAQVDSIVPRAQRGRYKGAETAPVTIVEVSDFQCPYCRQFAETSYRQLDSVYIRTGKVRMVFINLPLGNHTRAYAASEAAMCASAQGKFWPMHDRLFSTQAEWSRATNVAELLEGYAAALELDLPAFRDCVLNDRTAALIVGDAIEASAGGVNGTPAFFLAGPGGRRPIAGAVTWEALQREVELVLRPAAGGQPAPAGPPPAPN